MARPKKTGSDELVRIIDSYYTTEAAGDPGRLKCSLLEQYAAKIGHPAKAYDFRRDTRARERMEELKELAEKEQLPSRKPGLAYKSLDINRILSVRRNPEELAAILLEIDKGWERVYEEAVWSGKLVTGLQVENGTLRKEKTEISDQLVRADEEKREALKEARRLTVENRYLRKMLKTYLYPALANEILVEEGQIKNSDTEVTEAAKEQLIDGKFPASVTEIIKKDVKEIQTIEDALDAMWEGLE